METGDSITVSIRSVEEQPPPADDREKPVDVAQVQQHLVTAVNE